MFFTRSFHIVFSGFVPTSPHKAVTYPVWLLLKANLIQAANGITRFKDAGIVHVLPLETLL